MIKLTGKSPTESNRGMYKIIVTFDESNLKKTYEVYKKNKRLKKVESTMKSNKVMEKDILYYKSMGYK